MKVPKVAKAAGILGVSFVAGLLAHALSNRSQNSTTDRNVPTNSQIVATQQDVRTSSFDPQSELAALPLLSNEESLAKLAEWMSSPHALAQQYELYDAVGRTRTEEFPTIDATLLDRDDELSREARATLIARWLYEEPGSLLRHRHNMKGRWRGSAYYNLDTIFRILVSDSVSAAHSLLQQLETDGAELRLEYRELYQALLSLQPSVETKAAMLFAVEGASRVGVSLERDDLQPRISVAEVKEALLPENQAAAPHRARNLFTKLAQSDTDAAMQLALEVDNPEVRDEFLNIALPLYAKSDPANTVWIIGELFEDKRRNAVHGFANALAIALETDPSSVDLWYRSDLSEEEANSRLFEVLQMGAGSRPGLLPLINRLPPSNFRDQHMRAALSSLAYQDVEKAEAWIAQNLDSSTADRFRLDIIGPSYRKDPETTLAFFNSLPNSPEKTEATRQLTAIWANENFGEAIEWATQNPDADVRRMALQTLAHHWVETDLDSAIAFLNSETDPATQQQFRNTISRTVLNYQSPEGALKYLDSLPEGTDNDAFYHQAFDLMAIEDPLAALSAVQDRNLSARSTQYSYQAIARRWLRSDPEVAAPALLSAGGEISSSSLYAIAEAYRSYDPLALEGLSESIADPQLKESFDNAIEQARIHYSRANSHW